MNSEISNESIILFEEKLADTIKEHVESKVFLVLSVDYGPDNILDSIVKETGVNTNFYKY